MQALKSGTNPTLERLMVDGFSEAKFDESLFQDLILPDQPRQMIEHLTRTYFESLEEEDAGSLQGGQTIDFLEGKGQGLIFLLHGKPGVGKTYTAGKFAHPSYHHYLAESQ
jgi:signal recognition particle GTPase